MKKLIETFDIKGSHFEVYGIYEEGRSFFPVEYEVKIQDKDGTVYIKRFKTDFETMEFLKSLFLS